MPVDRSQLPAVGSDPVFRFPDIVRHTLSNGIEVRTIEHRAAPVITFVLQVEGGSGADPTTQEGLAAITADMVDEGTGSLSAIDVSDAITRIGADYDVDVASDVTTFSLTTLERFSARGAQLLADLLIRPSLREADFQRVRQLRLDRLRQLKDVAPAVAERAFLRLLYGEHPYGHLAIGNDHALRALSIADIGAFHAERFVPSQATMVMAGDMTHDAMRALADASFGGWTDGVGRVPRPGQVTGADPAIRLRASEIEPADNPNRQLAIVPREGAAQSELRIGHLAAQRNTPDYSALLVMNSVLGGQFVSRVNLKLREEKGYTYGARTGFDWRRGRSPFSLQTSVHTAATADAVRDAHAEIEGLRGARPVTANELALAKASLTRGYPRNFETAAQVARAVGQLALYGLPDTYFQEFMPKVNAVTQDDVTRVAAAYLHPGRLTTLVVGDHAAIRESMSGLFGEALVLSPEV
jgi:predicted Zn-dependent peptidase